MDDQFSPEMPSHGSVPYPTSHCTSFKVDRVIQDNDDEDHDFVEKVEDKVPEMPSHGSVPYLTSHWTSFKTPSHGSIPYPTSHGTSFKVDPVNQDSHEHGQGFEEKCEIKVLYGSKSSCDCCINWVDRKPVTDDPESARRVREERNAYAILQRKQQHGSSAGWITHSLVINSKRLKSSLARIFKGYPPVCVNKGDLVFKAPFIPLFHRLENLKKMERDESDTVTKELLQLLQSVISTETDRQRTILQSIHETGLAHFEDLPTLFVPGEVVIRHRKGNTSAGLLRSARSGRSPMSPVPSFILEVSTIEWSGDKQGVRDSTWEISEFSGPRPVALLQVLPFSSHKDQDALLLYLVSRGRKYQKFCGRHFYGFTGTLTQTSSPFSISFISSYDLDHKMNERVMIDHEAYYNFKKQRPPQLESLEYLDGFLLNYLAQQPTGAGTTTEKLPSHEACLECKPCFLSLLASPTLDGFALESKVWGSIEVDGLKPIEWSEEPFSGLVIDDQTKNLICAITQSADSCNPVERDFDDFISSKGAGIVILLHGPPGTGKTLTAEMLAETLHCPLYRLDAADLGSSAEDVGTELREAMELCARWSALLLIDEADVFLESRSGDSLQRNELVQVFLRTIEYYKGIMILTTNRAQIIDPAFESRIDMAIPYEDLRLEARADVWRNFLYRLGSEGTSITDEQIRELARTPLNGRQIKSAVKVAQVLARYERIKLGVEHVERVVTMRQKAAGMMKDRKRKRAPVDGATSPIS